MVSMTPQSTTVDQNGKGTHMLTERQQAVLNEIARLADPSLMCPQRKYPGEIEAYNDIKAAVDAQDVPGAMKALDKARKQRGAHARRWCGWVRDSLIWAEEVLSVEAQAVAA